ncbi:ATPase family protein 2 homolog isoform X2 [Stegodyphus dumicola]|uniref:ATPase family protein 2 homolog isoform X2 n=1 Tax=Stegodyphus dumicola TaxID=202533 RepID=UPI0015AECB77|nr:ATPase family protein 2 homolog isoform X2 [Stegodyphus dumicola]
MCYGCGIKIFSLLLKNKKHSMSSQEIEQCIESSHGFTGKDLVDSLVNAHIFACARVGEISKVENVEIIFQDVKEAFMRRKRNIVASSDMTVKKVCWNDIGGMHDVKEKLKYIVEMPLKYPESYKRVDVAPPRGVLLYGPPGCSKTMIAKALATESNLNFISKNTSDLFNKYVGESERAVRDLFAAAKARSPCIIFLDEIDALVSERGSGSGVGDRIVTTLLTEIDGTEELRDVIVIAATNRPDMLDDALVRSGRISDFIYVPLPDQEAREEILRIQMRNRVIHDLDFKYLSLKMEGYTGAEIVNLCNEAVFQLLAEDPDAMSPVFKLRHFEKALQCIPPRTSKEMIAFYENFNSKHSSRYERK